MAFRIEDAISSGFNEMKNYLIKRDVEPELRNRMEKELVEFVERLGPAVTTYPSWHPLVKQHDLQHPEITPSDRTGYAGLDHTMYFVNGFITCPYGNKSEKVLQSVERLPSNEIYTITAEVLDLPFYNANATSVLVTCEWKRPLGKNNIIPKNIAVPLMLEQELPGWTWASYAEKWETMRPYILGSPHGNRSSLFVDQDTALALKKAWEMLVNSGMFGPLKY